MSQKTSLFLSLIFVVAASADLPRYDPEQVEKERAAIANAFTRTDITSLRRLLRDVSFYGKPAAAMSLARLDATDALPELRVLNKQYARFACDETGEFGIAVILLEEKGIAAEKRRLLEIATGNPREDRWPISVIDRAGRELAAYGGDLVIEQLRGVMTYGAQYSVLYLTTRELPTSEIVERCIKQLGEHDTPQKAEAAEDILIGLGTSASASVRALRDVMRQRVKGAETRRLAQTIVNRCNKIVAAHERAKAMHSDG